MAIYRIQKKTLAVIAMEPGNDLSALANTEEGLEFLKLVPKSIRQFILDLPGNLLDLDESALKRVANPTPTEYAVRIAYWREHEKKLLNDEATPIRVAAVCEGICDESHFHYIAARPAKLAWMIRPLRSYKREMETALVKCTERLNEILDLPLYDSKGNPNPKTAAVLIQAIKLVDDRVNGVALQRQQQVRVNVETTDEKLAQISSMGNIDDKIKALEAVVKNGNSPTNDTHHLPAKEPEFDIVDVFPMGEGVGSEEIPKVPDEKSGDAGDSEDSKGNQI